MEDFCPQGKLETVLVENLSVLLWRKRRLLQAENAEISERMEFTAIDSLSMRRSAAEDCSRAAIASGGLLRHCDNPFVVREARDRLLMFRLIVAQEGYREDSRLFKKLFGEDQDGRTPDSYRPVSAVNVTIVNSEEKQGDQPDESEFTEAMVATMDTEIKRLTKLEKMLTANDRKRMQYQSSAAVIPGQQASDRLLRYETHLSREIDRILNRLERLQRMRKGQPLPPQVDVNIS
jgi:hypothetical protein